MESGADSANLPLNTLSFIGKLDSFTLPGAYGHSLFHQSILLLPGLNHVGPRGQSSYCKRSVVARHGEEWMVDDADIGAHPGMDVAFDGDHDFLAGEGLNFGIAAGDLVVVPLGVQVGLGVDVVIGGVAVFDFNILSEIG